MITLEIHQRIIYFNSLYSLAGVFPRCNLDSDSCCLSLLTQTFRISGGCDQRRCSGCSEVFQDDWGLGYSLLDAMVGIHRHVPPMMNACTWQMQWVSSSTVFGLLSENDAPRWATFHKDSRHLKTKCCQPWGKVERCWEWCCWFCHGFCSLSFFIQPESLLRSRSPRTCSLFWMPTFLRCRERAPKAGDGSWHSWCHWLEKISRPSWLPAIDGVMLVYIYIYYMTL